MITVISGTNRRDSRTQSISKYYSEVFTELRDDVNYFSLEDLPHDIISEQMYSNDGQHPFIVELQDEKLIPSNAFVFVLPEYNGTFPGIFKLFIDILSVRKRPETFNNKSILLTGVASGRAGNLRGLDQITTALQYLGCNIYQNKLCLSGLSFDPNGALEEDIKSSIKNQVLAFNEFISK